MTDPCNPLLERSPFEVDEGHLIGRDPRSLTEADFASSLPDAEVGLRAIRLKCLDCASSWNEVRKCVVTKCPLWHLRAGSVPKAFRVLRKASDAAQDEDAA